MAVWAKPKMYWQTMLGSLGSTLTATSTATNKSVADIYNMLETNNWEAANTTTPMYITYDAGVGNTATADYLAIIGHNLNTIGATIALQYSTDNFAADVNDAFTAEAPSADTVYLKELTAPGVKRYWRLKITGALSAAPYMAICIWGLKTELDYATVAFDPHSQTAKTNINLSQSGYVTGVHERYVERNMTLKLGGANLALHSTLKTWWETSGMKNVFVAWDFANNPSDVFLMRPSEKFHNPFMAGGNYRDLTLEFKGRRE